MTTNEKPAIIIPTREEFNSQRINHWNKIARMKLALKFPLSRYYHQRINDVCRLQLSPDSCVLELGCGTGDHLAALGVQRAIGVDFSSEMIDIARERHPQLRFIEADAHDLPDIEGQFDVIILSDFLNDIWDVQQVLDSVRKLCSSQTRVIINFHSHLWEIPLRIAQKIGLTTSLKPQNWLAPDDVNNLLKLSGFETIRAWHELLLPIYIPLLSSIFNVYLVRFFPFNLFALANFVVARPTGIERNSENHPPSVSVIVAARNEAGHISSILERVPKLGSGTEIIFVEGNSTDDTYETIKREIALRSSLNCKLYKQPGKGKGDAVRLGFEKASGDIFMILDADLTVPPEALPLFYKAIIENKGEFINGVRLVYPMEKEAMRFFNLIGNKFFSIAFSWLLGQPIKDTLCGTKVLWKDDYARIAGNRSYFGDFDPFGDFDLIFGASKLNLRIIDLPIRYYARSYGDTNISRWQHGVILLRMLMYAAWKIKYV